MLTRIRRRIDARPADAGVSLIELLVSIGLATFLGGVTMVMFVSLNSATASTADRTIGANHARTVLQPWTYYLQVSDGSTAGVPAGRFVWIGTSDMLFRADLNNRTGSAAAASPTLIWLRRDSTNQLIEEQFSNWSTSNTGYTTCRILADDATALTFTAYSSSTTSNFGADPVTPGTGCQRLTTTTSTVASTDLTSVTGVQIAFTITNSSGKRTQQYSATVNVPALTS